MKTALENEFELKWRMSARASAMIVQLAGKFKCSIEMTYGTQRADVIVETS